ncbi:MAG: site-specific DNA-methyltransferase [Rubrobacter sp.]|nr:site-specific DNA-methyltransferase [Rubrobacter sp.]
MSNGKNGGADSKPTVAERRQYSVANVEQAKKIASKYLNDLNLESVTSFGLPEVDDRYHVWRVPVLDSSGNRVGEVIIDARTTLIDRDKTTKAERIEARLLKKRESAPGEKMRHSSSGNPGGNAHNLRNVIALGEAAGVLEDLPPGSVDLVFTSPPYYNARIEYREYSSYSEYLNAIRLVIRACHRTLAEGRFFVMNVAPILLRRANRSQASKRIAVPFDIHAVFISEGFDFVDDIVWVKPEGAGWATGRGRRFAADRNPLQYKPVPVTENVLVYRKQTSKLIDWNIRSHPRPEDVSSSKVSDGYEVTNLWKIKPRHSSKHPAVFPLELATRVVRYYSFANDVVLDPFAGIGTTGHAASSLGRKFVMIEAQQQYVRTMVEECHSWADLNKEDLLFVNCQPEAERLF